MKKVKIGLFGFGCVGQGLYSVLKKTPGLKTEIKKICIKDPNKQRTIGSENFTDCKEDLLNDPEINVIVELIDDSEEAFNIVSDALKNKKAVVTANKKMVSEHLEELIKLQEVTGSQILYEAACCGGIPIIRNLEEYYDNDILQSITGIVNGTTNYILSEIYSGKSYEEALNFVKQNGYAESNPVLDVEGYDSKYKLNIMLMHAFGLLVKPEKIFNLGIQRVNKFDMLFAKSKGYNIKLIAKATKTIDGNIAAYVLPELIIEENLLNSVNGVYNAIVTESIFAERNVFIGKGAGAFPTAAAVLSDLSALSYEYKYEYKKRQQLYNRSNIGSKIQLDEDFFVNIYLRFDKKYKSKPEHFEEIFETYYSRDHNYLTGKINFKKLIDSEWINNNDMNVLLLSFDPKLPVDK